MWILAFSGAYGLFLVTEPNFDEPDKETQMGKNAADAAKQVTQTLHTSARAIAGKINLQCTL